jgi:cellulose synthase/poly-beta-1,6-N-acetylglucosamine synthase-like glycosyltransferase
VAAIYVDSGSTDSSVAWARGRGIETVELDSKKPFTAARARNAGLRRLWELYPDLSYVQFIDGDCELNPGWVDVASKFLDDHPDVAAVAGRLRERYPEQSIYNWLCECEWHRAVGETASCGGIAMMRGDAVSQVGGFRDSLIAGEEPELCFRLRAASWRIWRLPEHMAWHDARMTRFGQWWRRAMRGGYVAAEGVSLHGTSPARYQVWESLRAWFWAILLPLAGILAADLFGQLGLALWLLYPLQILRQTLRNEGPLNERLRLAVFQLLSRFAESWGQVRFLFDRLLGRQGNLIEYK